MTNPVKKNIYFISDAHLAMNPSELEKENTRKLLQFLDFIGNREDTAALYLNGDIFDFWFEWRHVIPKYWFPVLYRLRQLVDQNIPVNFISGNHDFHFGHYLQEQIGIHCFHESCDFTFANHRFFVAHGDGLAKTDRGYRILKKMIRNPVSIFLFKTFIHADLGMSLARWTSHSSRQWVKIEKHAWSEEYYAYACKKFNQGFDFVILGHIHFPMHRQDPNTGKTYVNCGDWMNYFSYACYDGDSLSLRYWMPGAAQ